MKKQKARSSPKNRSMRRGRNNQEDAKSVSTYNGDSQASIFSDDTATTPIRPPRKKKKGRGGSGTDTSVPGSVLQRRKSVRSSVRSNRSNRSIRNSRRTRGGPNSGPVSYNPSGPPSFVSDHPFRRSGQGLRRADSRGRGDLARRSARRSSRRKIGKTPGFMNGNTANGDVYTRVAIPRSKSFMNVNNQYNLQELFKELKEKEGVESIDDVLKKVISPNGISFNEIKPVYRELLLKLAMTMSQDELFQRSKNIMSAEKKKTNNTTKKKEKSNKKSYPVSASEQSTLSSFLKLTFSSNKNNGVNADKSSTFTKDNSKKTISKTDISGPMPIHPPPSLDRKTPKTTRKATSPLPPTPSPPHSTKIHPNTKTKKPPIPTDDFIDDAYVSCSECYESVCNYSSCSEHGAPHKKIPPPKGYQANHVIKAQVHHSHVAAHENDSIHDCDTDSCISSEKCYCSLRKDPRSTSTTTPKLRPKLAPIPSDSDGGNSCCGNHFTTSEMSDSATDTTCYSVRHVPVSKHNHSMHLSLSGAETPQTAWRRNSKSISNDNSSDLYSDAGIMLNSSASSSGSCKMCEVHHKMHHEDDHSNLSRKNSGNSGGSGYQSNDSTCCSHHCSGSHGSHSRPITSPSSMACSTCQCTTSACSSCQTSLAGSLMSTRRSRPKLSLPYSHSHINLSAAGLGSPMDMERSSRGRSSSPQKMLVVSALDRSGKVRNNPNIIRKISSARQVRRDSEDDCKICDNKQFKMRVHS